MAVIWSVEDEETIGILIEKVIKSMGHEGRRFEDGFELERQLKTAQPDLLLLDLMLHGRNGFVILRDWKQDTATKHIPVIILSARSTETDKVKGLDLGADDYVTKPFGIDELKARINAALRRVTAAAQSITLGDLTLEPDNRRLTLGGETLPLTQQEYELVHYMMRHAGKLVTRDQLLRDVWGFESQTDSTRTVDFHIRSLRKKLGDDASKPRFIQTVHGSGYRLLTGE